MEKTTLAHKSEVKRSNWQPPTTYTQTHSDSAARQPQFMRRLRRMP